MAPRIPNWAGTRCRWQSALRPGQARPRPVWTDYTTENISPLTSLERLLGEPAVCTEETRV